MYQYPHVSQLFILLPWQSRVYPEPLKVVEFVQLTTECCWGQPSDPCQRGCLTSHACVMWGPRTLNADDDDQVYLYACFRTISMFWDYFKGIYMLQSITRISQYLGLTEPTRQSLRLSDTTSQYIGLPKNISQSLGLSEYLFCFSHTLTEMRNTFKLNFPAQKLIPYTAKTVLFDSLVNTKIR